MKRKAMGTEYRIIAKGNWGQIAKAINSAKEAIEKSQCSHDFRGLLDINQELLERFVTPKDDESFSAYKRRLIESIIGPGLGSRLSIMLSGGKIPFDFHNTLYNGQNQSKIVIRTVIKRREYHLTVDVNGEFKERGYSIVGKLQDALSQNAVEHSYKTLDRLV